MIYEDGHREKRKISAAWAVDEDISRLLKSLPNWFMVSSYEGTSAQLVNTPSGASPTSESETDVCYRNERESEILIGKLFHSRLCNSEMRKRVIDLKFRISIFGRNLKLNSISGNLGTAKQLVRDELITDIEVIRSLACIHESLKWFCSSMRSLIEKLPESSRNAMHKCVVQLQRTDENGTVHQSVSNVAAYNFLTVAVFCFLGVSRNCF